MSIAQITDKNIREFHYPSVCVLILDRRAWGITVRAHYAPPHVLPNLSTKLLQSIRVGPPYSKRTMINYVKYIVYFYYVRLVTIVLCVIQGQIYIFGYIYFNKPFVELMEEDRMPKKIFTQELEGTRRRERPRKGWEEEVERDLQVLGVRRWRELVADKKKWKDIVRQAKAHSGL